MLEALVGDADDEHGAGHTCSVDIHLNACAPKRFVQCADRREPRVHIAALDAIDRLFGYAGALGKFALRLAQQRACGSDLCGIHQLWISFLQHGSSQISRHA